MIADAKFFQILRRVPSLAIFALALAIRIGWIFAAGESGLQYSDDARVYHDLAVHLAHGDGFVTEAGNLGSLRIPYAQRPPLTPFALAAVYRLFGSHLVAGQLLFALLGSITVLTLTRLGRVAFSERVGLIAGFLAAVYPFFVFLTGVPLTENVAIVLCTTLGLLLFKERASPSLLGAILVGVVLGLATLNRPQTLGFMPFLVALTPFLDTGRRWSAKIRWLSVAMACWIVALVPWTIRNRSATGGWVLVSLQGGLALNEGNNPYTQTAVTKLLHGSRGWYDDPRFQDDSIGLRPIDADRIAFRRAIVFMKNNPDRALWYSVQKLLIFLKSYDSWIARLAWYPVLGLSLIGVYWSRGRWQELLPIYFLVVQTASVAVVFTSMPRFRAPVEPLFLLMAAFAADRLWRCWSSVEYALIPETRQEVSEATSHR